MFKNYIKIAWRSLWRDKIFSLINIISLSIGLSASFVIGMMVYYDFTFDTFHKDGDRIYRLVTDMEDAQGTEYYSGITAPMRYEAREGIVGIEQSAYFYNWWVGKSRVESSDQLFTDLEKIILTDKGYFELFDYEWIAGSKSNALSQPNQVILTTKRAKEYFPDLLPNDVIGKTITYDETITAQITGIVADFEQRTDLIFNEFVSLETAKQTNDSDQIFTDDWGMTNTANNIFIKLQENTSSKTVQAQLDQLALNHKDEYSEQFGQKRQFRMQPLSDLHLNDDYGIYDYTVLQSSKEVLLAIAGVALFLLLLGSINFINLNTAQATKRAKEIGVRKTLGSSRKQLIVQFLTETFIITGISVIVSIALSVWMLQIFAEFIPKGLDATILLQPQIILFIIVLFITVALLSGIYPALVLSHFKPAKVIKGNAAISNNSNGTRKVLTVFQFTIAQVFIIATILVGKQIHFMTNKDLGFKTDTIAFIETPWQDQTFDNRQVLENGIKSISNISQVSLGGRPPASQNMATRTAVYKNGQEEITTEIQVLNGDTDYLDIYNIPLLAGRTIMNDTIEEYVINQTAMRDFGFKRPEDAINKYIEMNGKPKLIVGVMGDFNQRSLKSGIIPLVFTGDTSRDRRTQFRYAHITVATSSTGWQETLDHVEQEFNKVYPGETFQVTFVDESIANFYVEEQRISTLLHWATGLAVLISCLGLLGLVIHTTERRTKEIGIRKVLGATVIQINNLLCKDFLILVIIAFVIATPIAYYFMNHWLTDFAYKTEISFWVFMAGGTGMIIIALAIMSFKTINTAMKNPVNSLKTE
ncbi:ABC transporter permease [Nonlabens agnitus]|uniref:Cell division protein FtsX n=1 Tax=Nonlabens agnitus TaxID=870484 RepID=A0A2S9WS11_9FLAO|nr:FtsX-like permease family protein [Nonlabens agnitus]PRP66249.1 cell division protein FtsX [Nonlabens agnitus]